MSFYDEDEGVCFDFTLEVTPKSKGDFGCIRMGGMSRTIKECLSQAEEIEEQIKRHVDGVDSVSVTVIDQSGQYEDMSEWVAKQVIGNDWNPKWENYKDKLPQLKTSYEDKATTLEFAVKELLNESSFHTNFPDKAEYLEELLKEWDSE